MRLLAALAVYGAAWGLAVETADALLGDPFEPLDVVTLAIQVGVAIVLWPLFLKVWGPRSERS